MAKLRLIALAVFATVLAACSNGDSDVASSAPAPSAAAATRKAVAADYTNVVQYMYVSYYGRPGDPSGVGFWAGYLAQAGNVPTTLATFNAAYGSNTAVRTVLDNFGNSQESRDLYGTDNTAIVNAIYQNLFNRAPDPGGRDFYVNGLANRQITTAQAAAMIASGAQGTDAQAVQNKVAVATTFTNSLTLAQTQAYSGNTVNAQMRTMLAGVGLGTNVATAANGMLAALPGTGGGGGGGGGSGSASACIDPTTFNPGTNWSLNYRTTKGAVVTTANSSGKINGSAAFEGVGAIELEFTGFGAGFGASVDASGKAYVVLNGLVESTYGAIGQGSFGGFAATFKTVYSPAQITRFDLNPGDSYPQTFSQTTTTTVAGLPFPIPPSTSQVTLTTTYVGQESVTVPAGTYNTCKFTVARTTVSGGTTTVDPVFTQWLSVGKGMPIKQVTPGATVGEPDSVMEYTGGTFNGAPL